MAEKKDSQPDDPVDPVAAAIENAHAAVTAAIAAGFENVDQAMQQAEEAVSKAVTGAAEAIRAAQQQTKKPDAG